ncbi:DMT family transporter [Devosia sp. A16]|uniref:DMT family transporter n=1 Tax=Devosia sp. A16 TaxID=1736675 RepID=UPI0009EAC92A|nr:DMT family transporter [Devosia sp. A16]
MPAERSNLRGIIYMVLASGCFTVNNGLLKLAVLELPPLEALFLRALAAIVLGVPVLIATASLASLRYVLQPWVLARNVVECAAAIAFVFAVANAPLADITALLQLTPMLVMLGAVVLFGDRIGGAAIALIAVALFGALLVAQPGGHGFQPYVLFGFASAALSAGRDLIGRRVDAGVPALAVAVGLSVVSVVGIGVPMLAFERWVTPSLAGLLLIAGASAFLTLAQLLLFLSFRVAETRAVVPFFYTGTLWALLIGALVFGTLPNAVASIGICLIAASGVLVLLLDRRARPR